MNEAKHISIKAKYQSIHHAFETHLMAAIAIMILLVSASYPIQSKAQGQTPEVGYICNPPLPYMPFKLDVLFIGNSFSLDTSAALPTILQSLGMYNVSVYVLYKGGCSMKEHYDYFLNDKDVYELWLYDSQGERQLEKKTTIRNVMKREPYDVVVFQQYSLESGNYSSYEPYLAKILQAYKITTISPRTTFAFNQTWAYSSKHKDLARYGTQTDMWRKICDATKRMKDASGIDVIIPCGTAVQNARSMTAIETKNEWTRDNQHISQYQGRYLLACTFFEAIIAPCFGIDIRGDKSIYGKSKSEQVDESNRKLIQNCAKLAVANNYTVSEFADQPLTNATQSATPKKQPRN